MGKGEKVNIMMNKMMYAEAVASRVNGEVQIVTKTNGVEKVCVVVKKDHYSPCIYIGDMFDAGLSVDDAEVQVRAILATPAPEECSLANVITDWDVAKDMLELRLYNENTPAEVKFSAEDYGFDDLIIIPYVKLSDNASIKVNNSLMKSWGVSEDLVFDKAKHNTEKNGLYLKTMFEALIELMPEMKGCIEKPEDEKLWVLSNNKRHLGAIQVIVFQMEINALMPNGYYVIPSSIHEVLIVPNGEVEEDELNKMVKTVNEEQIMLEDQLSNHVYKF